MYVCILHVTILFGIKYVLMKSMRIPSVSFTFAPATMSRIPPPSGKSRRPASLRFARDAGVSPCWAPIACSTRAAAAAAAAAASSVRHVRIFSVVICCHVVVRVLAPPAACAPPLATTSPRWAPSTTTISAAAPSGIPAVLFRRVGRRTPPVPPSTAGSATSTSTTFVPRVSFRAITRVGAASPSPSPPISVARTAALLLKVAISMALLCLGNAI